jgi:hypothetical protein
MIAQGGDGLSQGDLSNGVMAGQCMMDFAPLHCMAFERCPHLQEWIREWCSAETVRLEQADGFDRAHEGDGAMVWSPHPATADVAVEQLCEAQHTRSNSFNVVVVPSIMTGCWRKKLRKVLDVMFNIPIGIDIWLRDMYQSLTCAIVCPLLDIPPWKI